MNYINYLFRYHFLFFLFGYLSAAFTPDTTDYDAFGTKIAMNDHFLLLAQNDKQPPAFFIQFAPYNQTQSSSLSSSSMQCSITYPSTNNFFVYTVNIPKQQNQTQLHFFFAGENFTNDQSTPFVGMATYNQANSCNTSFTYSLRYLHDYQHQEYYIIGSHPSGRLLYGFSNEFVFVYNAENATDLKIWSGNLTWNDTSFIPHAVDIVDEFGVVAGFIRNDSSSTVKYSPMIYLIRFNSSNNNQPITVIDQHIPISTPNTWQDLLTNSNANYYSAKYDMSVSINKDGNVLVGMQFISRVFLLSVDLSNPVHLIYVSRYTNGRTLGNGKSVGWFDNGIAAVLINVYTMSYEWTLSQVFLFDIYNSGYNSITTPLSVFPNSHQVLPSSFSSIFVNVVTSSSSLALLDDHGQIIIFSATEPEYYPYVADTKPMPFVTSPKSCLAGYFKNKRGVHDCILCPAGTKNPGNSSRQCIPCLPKSFCPLGAVADISYSSFKTISQAVSYPRSPESVVFDEVLLQTMFSIGSDTCLVKSPLFWAVIVAGLVLLIIVIMEIIHIFGTNHKSKKVRKVLQTIFRHTDLIGEGEYWIGGLVSFCVIVIVGFACTFSFEYVKQYPIETALPSYFVCDPTVRNAKFETNIQSLVIPFAQEEQEMFDMLNNQIFTLVIDFVNTMIKCDAISIEGLYGLSWQTLRWLDCNNVDSILTLTVILPFQYISVRVYIEDSKTMGGIRMGLTGTSSHNNSYTLKELAFHQAYSKVGYVLSRTLPVALTMTKVINETKPIDDMNSLFVTNDQYVRSPLTLTTLTIEITETSYYVKNLQEPIARQSEIIFRNVLFAICCLELFGLAFLLYKLVFKPLYYKIVRSKLKKKHIPNQEEQQSNFNGSDTIIYHF